MTSSTKGGFLLRHAGTRPRCRTEKPTLAECTQLFALFNAGRYVELENGSRLLVEQFPYSEYAWQTLVVSLERQDKESLSACRKMVELLPDCADAHNNLGVSLNAHGDHGGAIACYRRALTLKPDFTAAKNNLVVAQMSCGQLAEAWDTQASLIYGAENRFPHLPYWANETLSGKSILVWSGPSVGDEILMASMYPEIIAQSERCVIECHSKLVPLFTRSFPDAQIVPRSEPPHPSAQVGIDYQCASVSLARWLRRSLASFPRLDRFLSADPERVNHWRARLAALGPGPKIGFSWRSCIRTPERARLYSTLGQWGPILALPGVHFVNLQNDECSAELNEARRQFGVPLHAFTEVDMFNNLDETAALTQALDLVISAPTAVCSMAAALGVETWAIAYGIYTEWCGKGYYPWLPAVHYFNRRWNQTWDKTIERISVQLAHHTRSRFVAPPIIADDACSLPVSRQPNLRFSKAHGMDYRG